MAQEKAMHKPLVGLLVVAVFALIATALAGTDFCQGLKLSSMVVGVLLGMVLANTARPYFPEGWGGGLAIAAKQFLRTGIVFYGFRLTLTSLLGVGLEAVLVDIIIVLGTLILGNVLGRVLGLEREERMLIASGSAICGAAAVLATEPVLKAKAHNTVVAVATVVLFGTLSMLLYPVLYRSGLLSFLSDKAVGVYTGSTVHEVAHVVGGCSVSGSQDSVTKSHYVCLPYLQVRTSSIECGILLVHSRYRKKALLCRVLQTVRANW